MKETIEKVAKTLREYQIFAEVNQYYNLPVIIVSIHWGDWKHDHLRADHIIKELGGELIKAEVTEENGSDCYSADRYYLASWIE